MLTTGCNIGPEQKDRAEKGLFTGSDMPAMLNYYTMRGDSNGWEIYPSNGKFGVNIPVAGEWVIVYKTLLGNFGVPQTVDEPPLIAVIGLQPEDQVLGVWPLPAAYFVNESGQTLDTWLTHASRASNFSVPEIPGIPGIPGVPGALPELPWDLPDGFSLPETLSIVRVTQDSCGAFTSSELCFFDPSKLLEAMVGNRQDYVLPDIGDAGYATVLTALSLSRNFSDTISVICRFYNNRYHCPL